MIKVGIIGPTNILKLSQLTEKSTGFLLERAKIVGQILAKKL